MLWRYRTREKWHKGIAPLLAAIFKKLLVSAAAAKAAEETGEEGSALLAKAIAGEIDKGDGEGKEAPKPSRDELKASIEAAPPRPGRPELEVTNRPFQEQLQFSPQPQVQAPSLPPTSVLQPAIGRAQTPHGPIQGQLPAEVPRGEPFRAARPDVPPGILAGLKGGILNLPTTAGQIPAERTGRQAAFATGETLGDFLRANLLRLPTADPTAPSPSKQISQKRLDLLNQLESGKKKISTLKPFERIILRPPTTSTIDILEGELERDRELGLEKPEGVTDEEWFSANDETKRVLMGI